MKARYYDFIEENKNCSGYKDNPDMKELFEILNSDDNIIKMIESSDAGKPALAACAILIEKWHDSKNNCSIDFNDRFTKQAVGNLVKTILNPFGYTVTRQKDLPKNMKGEYFKSASCYKYDSSVPVTMKIVKTIVEA